MTPRHPNPARSEESIGAVIVTSDWPGLVACTIDWALRQTHPAAEIIVSDDGHRKPLRRCTRGRVRAPCRGAAALPRTARGRAAGMAHLGSIMAAPQGIPRGTTALDGCARWRMAPAPHGLAYVKVAALGSSCAT